MPRPPADQPLLTPERISQAALRLIDQDGLDDLSMRKLAAALGVTQGAIYHYYADKNALLHALLERVFEEVELPDLSGQSWQERLRILVQCYRQVALGHPHFVPYLFLPSAPVPRELDLLNALYGVLHDMGMPEPQGLQAGRMAFTMLRGVITAEVQGLFARDLMRLQRERAAEHPERYRDLLRHPPIEHDLTPGAYFDLALDLAIAGLEQRAREAQPAGNP